MRLQNIGYMKPGAFGKGATIGIPGNGTGIGALPKQSLSLLAIIYISR